VSGYFANAMPVGFSSFKAVPKSMRDRDDPGQKRGGNAGTRRRTGLAGGNNRERLGRSSRRLKICIRALDTTNVSGLIA
jgi:hypothetical protein